VLHIHHLTRAIHGVWPQGQTDGSFAGGGLTLVFYCSGLTRTVTDSIRPCLSAVVRCYKYGVVFPQQVSRG
jgi:hypothetical protein